MRKLLLVLVLLALVTPAIGQRDPTDPVTTTAIIPPCQDPLPSLCPAQYYACWLDTDIISRCEIGVGWTSHAAGSGDQVAINSGATTNPDFVSTGDIGFTDTSNTITADINTDGLDAIGKIADALMTGGVNAVTLVSGTSTTGECGQFDANGNLVGSGAACGAGAETNTLTTMGGVADDQVAVGSGAGTGAYTTIPDSDAAGEALQYDQATNTFSKITGLGAGGTVDSIQGDGDVATTGAILSIYGGAGGIDTAVAGDVLSVTFNATEADTEIEGVVDHDNLQSIPANDHLDWTADGVGTIHANNYVDNNTQLSDAAVKDLVGETVTGNTETRITVTYEVSDDTLDFVVDDDLANYDNTTSAFLTSEVDGSISNEINTFAGQSGTPTDALAVTIAGGTGITSVADAVTDTVTLNLDNDFGTSIDNSEMTTDTLNFDSISDAPTLDADMTITVNELETTILYDSDNTNDAAVDVFSIDLSYDAATADDIQRGLVVQRLASTGTGVIESLVYLDNAEDVGTVTNGINLRNTGGALMTNGWVVDSGSGGMTNALNVDDANVTNVLVVDDGATGSVSLTHAELAALDGVSAVTTGHCLEFDGTNIVGAGGACDSSPGGLTTEVQFNNAGGFDGDSQFEWDITNTCLNLGAAADCFTPSAELDVDGKIQAGSLALDADPSPNILLVDSTDGGEGRIAVADDPTVDSVMTFDVDIAGTLTTFLTLDGGETGDAAAVLPNDAIGLGEMAGGTDGNLITYDTNGDPAYVVTGTTGQVLTSNGAGAAPTFEDSSGGTSFSALTAGTNTGEALVVGSGSSLRSSAGILGAPTGTTNPGTCTNGDFFWDTDDDTDGELNICKGSNTFKPITGGGGSGDVTDVGDCTGAACFTNVDPVVGSALYAEQSFNFYLDPDNGYSSGSWNIVHNNPNESLWSVVTNGTNSAFQIWWSAEPRVSTASGHTWVADADWDGSAASGDTTIEHVYDVFGVNDPTITVTTDSVAWSNAAAFTVEGNQVIVDSDALTAFDNVITVNDGQYCQGNATDGFDCDRTQTAIPSADHIDAVTEIHANIKTHGGSGTNNDLLVWGDSALPGAVRCLEIDATGKINAATDTCANLGPGGTPTQIAQLDSDMTVADAGAGTITATVDASAIGVWDVGGLTIGGADATDQLILPLSNDAATPTLAFGDGNTGFYESADNMLRVSIGGTTEMVFTANGLLANLAGGGAIFNETASNTNPVLLPDNGDTDTGVGQATSDQLSLIAGAAEGLRIEEGVNGSVLATETVLYLPTDVSGDPGTPAADTLYLYVKSDSLWIKNDAGTATDLAASGSTPTQIVTADTSAVTSDTGTDGAITLTADNGVVGVWDAGGLTVGGVDATDTLVLPSSNDAATPTLAFGVGEDTGVYESSANVLAWSLGGTKRMQLSATSLTNGSAAAAYASVGLGVAATSTAPAFRFGNDTNTGMGTAGGDQVTLIAGATEGMTVGEQQYGTAAGDITWFIPDVATKPSTNPTGGVVIFSDADDLFIRDTAGNEVNLTTGGGGEPTTYEQLDTNSDIGFGAAQVPQGSATAPLASPALTGDPTGPTAALNDNDTSLATTAYVQGEVLAQDSCGEITGCVPSAITSTGVTYENLSTNSDIGFGAAQVPQGSLTAPLAGPTFTGAVNMGGASSVEIENAAALTLAVAGEVGVDTTCTGCDNQTSQLQYRDGTATRVVAYEEWSCSSYEDATTSTLNVPIMPGPEDITITAVGCRVSGTSATVTFQDSAANNIKASVACQAGTAAMTWSNASLTNTAIVIGEYVQFDVTAASAPGFLSACVKYTVDAR